jgi:hypothetical protein
MGNREYYEMKLEVIRAIEDDKIETPHHIPVGIYAQEAASLYYWALDDKDALAAVGLPPELVDDLPIRIEALKEASAYWDNYRNAEKKNAREWKTRAPLAYNLRKRLLTDFRHAFQYHPQQMKTVRNIAKGKSHDKMIRALNDLGVLGKKNLQLLEAVNFDMSLLDRAVQISKEMAKLLPDVNKERREHPELKKIRDQAYTHLKEAVDQIRSYGKYLFRDNKRRLRGYKSDYIRETKLKQRLKRKKTGANDPRNTRKTQKKM